MPTGACGVACDVCKLKLLMICSSCGPGQSQVARAKLAAQKRLLGAPCPILACAALRQVDYCLRDCDLFPCENFAQGPYPFSQSFLDMQQRRRRQRPPAISPYRSFIQTPEPYWEAIQAREITELCQLLPARPFAPDGLIFTSFHEEVLLDRRQRALWRQQQGRWQRSDDPQLELLTLLFLAKTQHPQPFSQQLISVADLKEALYFKGPHRLPVDILAERFGQDLPGFQRVARFLAGTPLEMADAAYTFLPLPRLPVSILLWLGDEEFPPQCTVLFDRSIEAYLSASGIWLLVNYVTATLLWSSPAQGSAPADNP